jgi:uncharacterized protein
MKKRISRRHAVALGAAAIGSAMLPKFARADSSQASNSNPTSYRILSFCGGGMRGLASATMLNELYKKHPDIISKADLLAGTSTGANIVAAIANGEKPEKLIEEYLGPRRQFFENPSADPLSPAYSMETFAKGVRNIYGGMRLKDIKQGIVTTAFNVGDGPTPWATILFTNLPGSSNGPGTEDTLVSDAVISSSAMPGMLGSYHGNIDGAFVNHDPTLAAIALAVNSGVDPNNIVAICFGTGFMANSLGVATSHWGPEQWQNGDKNNPYIVPPLLINGTPSPILNASLAGTSTNLIPELTRMLLPKRYAYLNPTLEFFIPENVTNLADFDYLVARSLEVDLTHASNLVSKYWG